MSDEYVAYFHTHPFPRFTSPDEPTPILRVPQPGAGGKEDVAGGE